LDFSAFLTQPTGNSDSRTQRQSESSASKGTDVPVYVEYGQAQLGIVGYDVLREKKHQVAHLVDLQFGRCRLSIAVKKSSPYRSALELPPHGRVASKFVHCAREYFYSLIYLWKLCRFMVRWNWDRLLACLRQLWIWFRRGGLKNECLIEIETLFESTARLIAHP